MATEKRKNVRQADLNKIPVGGSVTFKLPTAKACYNAKSAAYVLGRKLGVRFSVATDFSKNQITISKML